MPGFYETLLQPVVTEKATDLAARGKYAFIVDKGATKIDVKHAVKAIYGVDVKEVRIMNTHHKERMVGRGRSFIKKPKMKKAIVTLKGDKTIDVNKIKLKS